MHICRLAISRRQSSARSFVQAFVVAEELDLVQAGLYLSLESRCLSDKKLFVFPEVHILLWGKVKGFLRDSQVCGV